MSGIALVHDWLTGMRGGEKALEALAEAYPDADILTLVHLPGRVSAPIEAHRIRPSVLQRLPAIGRIYRHCLPLFPVAIELLDLDAYDLGDQHEPLRRQSGRTAARRTPRLLLLHAHAVRVGPVRSRTSARSGWDDSGRGRRARCSAGWPAGTPRRRAGSAAMSLSHIMLPAE